MIIRFYTAQAEGGMVDGKKFREDFERGLYDPAPNLRLYAFKQVERGLPYEYDSGFLAVMGSISPQ